MLDGSIFTDDVLGCQENALRLANKRGYTPAKLQDLTGIGADTIRTYRGKPSRKPAMMPLSAFIRLAKVLPLDLANILIGESGYELKLTEGRHKDWFGIAGKFSAFSSKVCDYAHGGFNHRENLELTEEIGSIAAEAQGMAR